MELILIRLEGDVGGIFRTGWDEGFGFAPGIQSKLHSMFSKDKSGI
jgi:hypothetical protein